MAASLRSLVGTLPPVAGPSRLPAICTCWRRKATTTAFPASPHASPFEILSLPRSADQAEIKDRYYELAKLYHPDSPTPVSPDVAKERYRLVSDAYALLKDPLTRQAYLRSGTGWAAGPGAKPPPSASRRTHSSGSDPFENWDPGVHAESPFAAYSGHSRATYQQAYSPGADWNKRPGYSRSSDEAARRAKYYAAARQKQQEARQREQGGGWPFASGSSVGAPLLSAPLVTIMAFVAVSVTLTVASRSSLTPAIEPLPDEAVSSSAGIRRPLSEALGSNRRYSTMSTSMRPSNINESDSPGSSSTFATSSSPALPSSASSRSGSSPSRSDQGTRAIGMEGTGSEQPVLLALPMPGSADEVAERERQAEMAYVEALRKRQLVLRDERRNRSFGKVDS